MAIAFRSKSESGAGGFSATEIVLDAPAGLASGDVLLFFICTDSDHTISYPDGFTQEEHSTLTASGFSAAWKLAGGSEPANYTFGFSGATEVGVAALLAYSGVSATPFDLDGIASVSGNPSTTAAITPSNNDSMLVGAIFIDPIGTPSITEATGYTLRSALTRNNNAALGIADKLQTSATNEGVQIGQDTGTSVGGYTLALAPAAGSSELTLTSSDLLSTSDVLNIQLRHLLEFTEALAFSDAVALNLEYRLIIDDTVVFSDASIVALIGVLNALLADSFSLTEASSISLVAVDSSGRVNQLIQIFIGVDISVR